MTDSASGDPQRQDPRDWPAAVVPAVLGGTVVVLVAAIMVVGQLGELVRNRLLVRDGVETLAEIERTRALLLRTESGARGYLLTGDDEYLEYYLIGRETYVDQLQTLRDRLGDEPQQVELFQRSTELITGKMDEMELTIRLRRTEGFNAAQEVVREDFGERAMSSILDQFDQMRRLVITSLDRKEEDAERSRTRVLRAVWTQTVLFVLLMLVTLALTLRDRRRVADYAVELEERVRRRTAELQQSNERLAAENRARREAESKLQKTAEELERSNRELNDFAFIASHDLQEPLRKIRAFGDRLSTGYADQIDPRGRDFLGRMSNAAARMSTLINDLLEFSRVHRSGNPFEEVDLRAVLEGVVDDLANRLDSTGGRVEIGAMTELRADPLQMRQLLQNLVGNALKFHREDVPPIVRVEARDAEADGRPMVVLTVEDNGIGFDEKYAERVFAPFQRLHGRGQYDGTGIGLAICRRIVERHEGSVTVDSEPGYGTRFTIRLPKQGPAEASTDSGVHSIGGPMIDRMDDSRASRGDGDGAALKTS